MYDPQNIRNSLFDPTIMYIVSYFFTFMCLLYAHSVIVRGAYHLRAEMTFGEEHGNSVSRGTANGYDGIFAEIVAYVAVQAAVYPAKSAV